MDFSFSCPKALDSHGILVPRSRRGQLQRKGISRRGYEGRKQCSEEMKAGVSWRGWWELRKIEESDLECIIVMTILKKIKAWPHNFFCLFYISIKRIFVSHWWFLFIARNALNLFVCSRFFDFFFCPSCFLLNVSQCFCISKKRKFQKSDKSKIIKCKSVTERNMIEFISQNKKQMLPGFCQKGLEKSLQSIKRFIHSQVRQHVWQERKCFPWLLNFF